jgi:hypothetical protein
MATALPKYFPSLSEDGWVTNTIIKANYLFAHFFIAEYSQTTLYPGYVSSLPYIIEQGMGDPNETANLLNKALSNYFTRYFNNVTVEVDYPLGQEGSRVYLTIFVSFDGPNGQTYSLGKIINMVNSKVISIENLNNG